MRQYRSLVRVLDRELAVRPLPETTRLYDDVRAGRLGPPPVAATPPASSTAPLTWPLVGRAAELAALRAAWQATGRQGRVVAIAGQAWQRQDPAHHRTARRGGRGGATVLAARCHDGETGLPFVLAADLLRTALAIRPDLPGTLPAQTAAMAGRLVPALAASQPDSAAPALDSPLAVTRLYAAIADTLRAAAGGGPRRARRGAARPPAGHRGGGGRALGGQLVARPARLPGPAARRLAAAARAELAARTGGPAAGAARPRSARPKPCRWARRSSRVRSAPRRSARCSAWTGCRGST